MIFYLFVFLILFLVSLVKNKQIISILFLCCGFFLFIIAAFRGDIDRDYNNYLVLYNSSELLTTIRIEPTFLLISYLTKLIFNDFLFLIIFYALLGVLLKFIAIKHLTEFWLLSVLIYFSNFFIYHEMTQIRVGVASALILISLIPLFNRKFWIFCTIILVAFLFHYSAILALPLYLLNINRINIWFFAIIIPIAYLFYFFHIQITFLIGLIPIPEIQAKFQQYKIISTISNTKINVFNYLQISRCLMAYVFLWKWELMKENNKFSPILIKIYILAISIVVLFTDIPTIGSRASELLMTVEIILIPYLIYVIKQKWLATIIISMIALLFLCINLFYSSLISGYFS